MRGGVQAIGEYGASCASNYPVSYSALLRETRIEESTGKGGGSLCL